MTLQSVFVELEVLYMGVLGVLGDGSPAKNTNVNCITRYALHGLALVSGSGL